MTFDWARLAQAHVDAVSERVERSEMKNSHEIDEARAAVQYALDLVDALGLGEPIGNLTPNTGKPQLLLMLEVGGQKQVLKVYGRRRFGEGFAQAEATRRKLPVVPTRSHGDNPFSYLIMDHLPGGSVKSYLDENPAQTESITRSAAANHFSVSSSDIDLSGCSPMWVEAEDNLQQMFVALRSRNYLVRDRWMRQASTLYRHPIRNQLIHGDSWSGNSMLESNDSRNPLLSDYGAVTGEFEYDAARWIMRESAIHGSMAKAGPGVVDSLTRSWMNGAPGTDEERLQLHLLFEAVSMAGINEVVKSSSNQTHRDPLTVALLDFASEMAAKKAVSNALTSLN